MSMEIIPFTPCPDCCECPVPTLQWDSRSASKTKCGVDFPGSPCPNARFLNVESVDTGPSTPPCPSESKTCDGITGTWVSPGSGLVGTYVQDPVTCEFTTDYPSSANCRTFYYSSPYTTAALIANTLAALPAFDDDWDDTAGSYRNLTTDELTYSIRESRYRFRFKIPKVGRGTCYKITWTEIFTPEEGDPVETDRCSIWDGEIPEGYDPDDPETWPIIGDGTNPYFELAIPETNGTVNVDPDSIVAVCRGCSEPCPE